MAHIPLEYRVEGTLRFIESGFKIEETIDWFLARFASLEPIVKSSNPRTLVRNMLTMGGSGWNQDLNIVAFGKAYDVVVERRVTEAEATRDKQLREAKQRIATLEKERERRAENELAMTRQLVEVKDQLHNAEKETLMLKASGV